MQTKNAASVIKTDSTAIRAMAIGRLRILEARVEKLSISTLTVDHLNVRSR